MKAGDEEAGQRRLPSRAQSGERERAHAQSARIAAEKPIPKPGGLRLSKEIDRPENQNGMNHRGDDRQSDRDSPFGGFLLHKAKKLEEHESRIG